MDLEYWRCANRSVLVYHASRDLSTTKAHLQVSPEARQMANMASTTKPANPPLVTADPATGTATASSLAGWTSTVTVDPTQTALDVTLPTKTAGLVLLLQPRTAPVLQNGCAECGPPISCLMCPSSFQCLMDVQADCSTCPSLRCVALLASPSTTDTPSATDTATETAAPSASPKIIGGVLGGVGGLIILALVMVYISWRRKHRKNPPQRIRSRNRHSYPPNLKKRDASGIIIDGNYLRERQDPLGCVRESHAELHEDSASYKSLSTLFEDNSSTSSPKSPILIYARRERTDRVRTPVLHQQFEPHTHDTPNYEPDLIVPQPAEPVHPPRGLSAIFQLPKPITSRLSLGSLFSDTGRLSLSFKSSSSPSSSVKQQDPQSLPQFSTPSTARDSSLTMSSNASNIIPIAYMPGVLDYSGIADQYSAYQERKAARRRENKEEEAKANSEHVEDASDFDPYISPAASTKNSSPKGSPLKDNSYYRRSSHSNVSSRFGPPLSSVFDSPNLQPPPLNTAQHMPNSSSLSTLFHVPSTPVPATPPLNVSGKFVTELRESHSQQSSSSSIATMSTASFERLWDQTGALVADENHIPPSPPAMNSPADRTSSLASPVSQSTDMQFVSAPTSPHTESPSADANRHRLSLVSTTESTTSLDARQKRYSATTTASYVSGESIPFFVSTASTDRLAPYAPGEPSASQESLTSIQPSVVISRASTMTRDRIAGRTIDSVFPPRSSSLRRNTSKRSDGSA